MIDIHPLPHRATTGAVQVDTQTILRIPSAWDSFTFRGFAYRRDEGGRMVCFGKASKSIGQD